MRENAHIEVREATLADVPVIWEITQEAFHKYQHDLYMPVSVAALSETQEDIARDLTKKLVLVGLYEGEIVGTVRVEFLGELAYFSRFGVKLASQNGGMGGALVRRVEKECMSRGIKAIALHTSAKMRSLIRFYYGNGYFIHSTRTDRGYIRALLINELEHDVTYDLAPVWER